MIYRNGINYKLYGATYKNATIKNTRYPMFLDYIESKGNAYINTNLSGTAYKSFSMNMSFSISDKNGSNQPTVACFFGNQFYLRGQANSFGIWNSSASTYSNVIFEYDRKYTAYFRISGTSGARCEVRLKIDNETEVTTSNNTYNINTPVCLFCWHNGSTANYFPYMKMYSCQIYADDEKILRDFRSCLSIESGHRGEACMFDLAKNEYYYSSTEYEFKNGKRL